MELLGHEAASDRHIVVFRSAKAPTFGNDQARSRSERQHSSAATAITPTRCAGEGNGLGGALARASGWCGEACKTRV